MVTMMRHWRTKNAITAGPHKLWELPCIPPLLLPMEVPPPTSPLRRFFHNICRRRWQLGVPDSLHYFFIIPGSQHIRVGHCNILREVKLLDENKTIVVKFELHNFNNCMIIKQMFFCFPIHCGTEHKLVRSKS